MFSLRSARDRKPDVLSDGPITRYRFQSHLAELVHIQPPHAPSQNIMVEISCLIVMHYFHRSGELRENYGGAVRECEKESGPGGQVVGSDLLFLVHVWNSRKKTHPIPYPLAARFCF